jgi:Tol biopolymer transport system component/predicted Ser/Thr protein kinase
MDLRGQLPILQALFEEALTYPEGGEREAFLDARCAADGQLRAEVRRVLEGYRQASMAAGATDALPRFGPFQALRLIGRGGMGSVYLAERADGEFQMQVAIKVVAGRFLSSLLEDSFRRERQILAGLNHPNIARLLDGGVEDGAPYLVMEYVDGQRLDEYCRQGALGTKQRIELLCTVCRAVEYAHAANVVHRDLKPSNILVTPEGEVKLLDFGSSKLLETRGAASPGQTVTAIRGYTPDFASPEQVEGRPTGTGADVYSLGILLARLCPEDRAAARVTARATERDPARRQLSVAAFRQELEQMIGPQGRAWSQRTLWLRRGPLAIAAVAAVVLLAATWRRGRNVAADDNPYVRLSPPGARWRNASLSADGRWLAYASDQAQANNFDIWLRSLDEEGLGRRLTSGPERDLETSVSPDGQYVAFYSDRQPAGIYRIEAATGRTELLAPEGRTPKYSPDGRWIAYTGSARFTADMTAASPRHRVKVIPASGGTPVDVSEGLPSAGFPVWSGDGSELLFQAYRDNAIVDQWAVPAGASLGVRKLRGKGEPNAPIPAPCAGPGRHGSAQTFPDPAHNKSLWVARFNGDPALRDASPSGFNGRVQDCSAARDGAMIVEGVENRSAIWAQALDPETGARQGNPVRARTPESVDRGPLLSWDGRWLAFQTRDDAIWVDDLQAAEGTSYPDGSFGTPVLSGDGRVLWSSERSGILTAKLREGRMLRREDRAYTANILWGANGDGRLLLVFQSRTNPRPISLLDTETNRTTAILSHPQWNLYSANFSPDERWVVFEAETPEGAAVYAAPFHGSEPVPVAEWIRLGAGDDPKWSADGASVFVLSYADGFGCVWRLPVDGITKRPAGPTEPWVHLHGAWSPRFLTPGYFRIAAARDKVAFLLGEQDEIVWRRSWAR